MVLVSVRTHKSAAGSSGVGRSSAPGAWRVSLRLSSAWRSSFTTVLSGFGSDPAADLYAAAEIFLILFVWRSSFMTVFSGFASGLDALLGVNLSVWPVNFGTVLRSTSTAVLGVNLSRIAFEFWDCLSKLCIRFMFRVRSDLIRSGSVRTSVGQATQTNAPKKLWRPTLKSYVN